MEQRLRFIDDGHTVLNRFLKGTLWEEEISSYRATSNTVQKVDFRKSYSQSSKREVSEEKGS